MDEPTDRPRRFAPLTSLWKNTTRTAEEGMTTAEYAIGTVAACTFAALLIAVVRSPEIKTALLGIITSALGLGR